ncbi:MAG: hypothetical protein BIFFINMI_03119 [Phycisphaerae bacterium]|nr:hypothetical protein [Phycisphaerae bacterium]
MSTEDWQTLYRWEWFHRAQWRGTFRAAKAGPGGGSAGCFARIVRERGGGPALDCSAGLGLKTIVMAEMGVQIAGSDGCGLAVEHARELARMEDCAVEFFQSTWAELPARTGRRFAAVFSDVLSWTLTREEFEAALIGLRDVLLPGGVLVFMGAGKASPTGPEHRRRLLDEQWARRPTFSIEWDCRDADTRCTCLLCRERGEDFIDEHHLYLVEQGGRRRLETATIRQPVRWDWPDLADLFAAAGFSDLDTLEFPGAGHGGVTIRLNVATR